MELPFGLAKVEPEQIEEYQKCMCKILDAEVSYCKCHFFLHQISSIPI